MKPVDHQASPGLAAAVAARKARKGPATGDDRPLRKSKPTPVLKGQLDIHGNEAAGDGR